MDSMVRAQCASPHDLSDFREQLILSSCGRGRKCRGRCVRAAGGRLTVGHVVCSRRAPVADATPHYHRLHRTDGANKKATYGFDVRRRCHDRTGAATAQSRHARGGADIRHVYIQLQLSNTLYIQNTVP